jgi:hypothetical protein
VDNPVLAEVFQRADDFHAVELRNWLGRRAKSLRQ